jgi:hypothetical protein
MLIVDLPLWFALLFSPLLVPLVLLTGSRR